MSESPTNPEASNLEAFKILMGKIKESNSVGQGNFKDLQGNFKDFTEAELTNTERDVFFKLIDMAKRLAVRLNVVTQSPDNLGPVLAELRKVLAKMLTDEVAPFVKEARALRPADAASSRYKFYAWILNELAVIQGNLIAFGNTEGPFVVNELSELIEFTAEVGKIQNLANL